jgi:hypothetical protein
VTAAYLDKQGVVDRQAKIEGSDRWHACGNVTMCEAARLLARYEYEKSGSKKLPRKLTVFVRDMDLPHLEFPHEVVASVNIDVVPLRGDD